MDDLTHKVDLEYSRFQILQILMDENGGVGLSNPTFGLLDMCKSVF